MASMAERKLQNTSYRAEMKSWNFEKYVTLHKEQHHVLDGLKLHGHKVINECSKVRYLNDGIKTTKLDTVEAAILASAEHRSDFDGCVNLYKDFITQSDTQPELRIAAVAGGGGGGTRTDDVVEDRYCERDGYKALSKGQKKYLCDLLRKRKERDGDPPKGKGKGKGGDTSAESKNSALEAEIATLDADVHDGEPDKQTDYSNRKHSAFNRQKRGRKIPDPSQAMYLPG